MSQAPHRAPPPPHPTPDDPYELQPVQPAKVRNLTAEIVTISVIVSALVLLGIGIILWYLENRPVGPAPAPTAAPTHTVTEPAATPSEIAVRPAVTPSPPIRRTPATATPRAASRTRTPAPSVSLPLVSGGTGTPATPRVTQDLHLPVVSADNLGSQTPPTLEPASPTETPDSTPVGTPSVQIVSLPFVSRNEVPPTPTETPLPPTATPEPTWTRSPLELTFEAATLTATPEVTPSPTPPFLATATPFIVNSLKARVASPTAEFHIGPSAVYTVTNSLNQNEEITLYGRNSTGEWIYACCVIDEEDDDREVYAWVRQAYIRIEGNESDDDPEDYNANDARWLRIEPARADLRPLPTLTPPPPGDFPLLHYTPDNRGYIPNLPNLSTSVSPWTSQAVAGGALSAPLVVVGDLVIAPSSDNYIYAIDRNNGNQRDRRNLGQGVSVSVAPATDDGLIYIADSTNHLSALQEPIRDDNPPVWRRSIDSPAISGINVFSHTLFLNRTQRLMVIDGEEGTPLNELFFSVDPQYPTIGGQLLFVVADRVRAYDVLKLIERKPLATTPVWEQPNFAPARAPAVYSARGVKSLAELYVAGANNRIYSLDANTGRENWNQDNEETSVTSMAVNDTTLFIAGNDYIKARSREDGEQLWRTPVAGAVLGGPLVNDRYMIAFLQNGNIVYLDAVTGQVEALSYIGSPALNTTSGAVSFPYVYLGGQNGRLYALRQSP